MIDYKAVLDDAWHQHLQEKDSDAPTVISTFAGCGGSSLGYSMAGFRELLAVEWDNNAAATFRLNFPDVPVYHGDIAKLTVDECLQVTGLRTGELDVFDGSPPCQGFSTAGKRRMEDERNQLFREYVRLLRGLKPKVFVMENVSGMVKGKMKLVFVDILKELKSSGYRVSARLLNTKYFNVPQSRERMIFIGVRDDLGIEPSHPKAEGTPLLAGDVLEYDDWSNSLTAPQIKMWNCTRIGKNAGATTGTWFNFCKIDPLKPLPTITKEAGSAKHCHWQEPKGLGESGLKKGGSFPKQFEFIGGYGKTKNRIGNSVPPLFMRAIARHVRREILLQ